MERLAIQNEVCGLSNTLIAEIGAIACRHGLQRVILFGSRARGDYRRISDIDLAVSGGNVPAFTLDVDEATHTLLRFDVVDLDGAVQADLRDAIRREGKVIYEKV